MNVNTIWEMFRSLPRGLQAATAMALGAAAFLVLLLLARGYVDTIVFQEPDAEPGRRIAIQLNEGEFEQAVDSKGTEINWHARSREDGKVLSRSFWGQRTIRINWTKHNPGPRDWPRYEATYVVGPWFVTRQSARDSNGVLQPPWPGTGTVSRSLKFFSGELFP